MSDSVYDENFYALQMEGSYKSAKKYAQAYLDLLPKPNAVVDFGCGRGMWLKAFKDSGIEVLVGVDGSWLSQRDMIDQDVVFYPVDLNQPIAISGEGKFDLAISVEVAEHLGDESAVTFAKSISGHSDVIIFSAAYENQGGTNHINERPHSYWGAIFNELGYDVYDVFRAKFWGFDAEIDFWYQQNVFLYVKRGSEQQAFLKQKHLVPMSNLAFMDCVHPYLFKTIILKNEQNVHRLEQAQLALERKKIDVHELKQIIESYDKSHKEFCERYQNDLVVTQHYARELRQMAALHEERYEEYRKLKVIKLFKPLIKFEQGIKKINKARKGFRRLRREKGSLGKAYQFVRRYKKAHGFRATKRMLIERSCSNINSFEQSQIRLSKEAGGISEAVLQEAEALSVIESALIPTSEFLSSLTRPNYELPENIIKGGMADVYHRVSEVLSSNDLSYGAIFIAPWLIHGGADLVTMHHINAFGFCGKRVLLITTENRDSTWLDQLDKKHCDVLELGKISNTLDDNRQELILTRILFQLETRVIHNINSDLAWRVFTKYGRQLNTLGKKLFVSVYAEDKVGRHFVGYGPKYLPNVSQYLTQTFCDTQAYVDSLRYRFGIEKNKIRSIYNPTKLSPSGYQAVDNKRILWASRITEQKRPDLLVQIAKLLPDYTIDVFGKLDEPVAKNVVKELFALSNVRQKGAYNGFGSLVAENKYSLFLYTSAWDGMPNVVLEAIANGLPVISSDVGGIKEVLHHSCLLSDAASAQEYAHTVKKLLSAPNELRDLWRYSKDIIEKRHIWEHFVDSMMVVDHYGLKNTNDF